MENSRSSTERTVLANAIPIDVPYVVGFWTGDVCNFKCKYCIHSLGGDIYNKNKNVVPAMMSWNVFVDAANALKEFAKPIKKILFSSIGEPLLNRRLPDMIRYVKSIGVADFCEVVTNASLLTNDLSRALIDSGLDRLCVSIQGVTAQKYKEISQIDLNYDRLVRELEYFYQYSRGKCKVHIKTVDIALDDGEEKIFIDTFSTLSDTIYIDNVIEAFQDVDYSKIISDNTKGLYGEKQKYRIVCSSVFYTLYILPDGNVTTCCTPPYPVILGNIADESLYSMYTSKKRIGLLKMQLEGKRRVHSICKNCIQPNAFNFVEDDLDEARMSILSRLKW